MDGWMAGWLWWMNKLIGVVQFPSGARVPVPTRNRTTEWCTELQKIWKSQDSWPNELRRYWYKYLYLLCNKCTIQRVTSRLLPQTRQEQQRQKNAPQAIISLCCSFLLLSFVCRQKRENESPPTTIPTNHDRHPHHHNQMWPMTHLMFQLNFSISTLQRTNLRSSE